jgi:hypothetical protein
LIRRAFCSVRTLLPACTLRGGFVGYEVRARISHREEGMRFVVLESGMGLTGSGFRSNAFGTRRSARDICYALLSASFRCGPAGI